MLRYAVISEGNSGLRRPRKTKHPEYGALKDVTDWTGGGAFSKDCMSEVRSEQGTPLTAKVVGCTSVMLRHAAGTLL